MLKVIRNLLQKIIDDIDAGNSNLNEQETIQVASMLREYFNKDEVMSCYRACQYLGISKATFYNYISNNYLPKGKHNIGFKELSWSKKELDECKNKIKWLHKKDV